MKVNKLNDLDGSNWLRLTKSWWTPTGKWAACLDIENSWWETEYPIDPTHKMRSYIGCAKPPSVARDLVMMFTKRKEWVIDTFSGTGGLILGAALANRQCVASDISQQHLQRLDEVSKEFVIVDKHRKEAITRRVRKKKKVVSETVNVDLWEPTFVPADKCEGKHRKINIETICGGYKDVMDTFEDESFHFIITDPPYGVGHTVKFDEACKMEGISSEDPEDIGNLQNMKQFHAAMISWAHEAYRILRKGRYVVVFMGDRYMDGELVPLGWTVAQVMRTAGFKLKGVCPWRNKTTQRPLKPYALGHAYVPNIIHQYFIVLRKEG